MKKKERFAGIVALVIVFVLLLFMYISMHRQQKEVSVLSAPPLKGSHIGKKDTSAYMALVTADSGKRPEVNTDKKTNKGKKSGRTVKAVQTDSMEEPVGKSEAESISADDSIDNGKKTCENDTISPWVYADPGGGLHHVAFSLKLFSTKPCTIQWKTDSNEQWKEYKGEEISIIKSTRLFLTATDSCGNTMEQREENYELKPEDSVRHCASDMEYILVGSTGFCIDKYEWPNKKGIVPRAYISVYQAMDSCVSVNKRLCTSDEWTVACSGPYGWKYPYGQAYEIHACVSNDTMARPSGKKPECRGYFGVFDMSGNLAEWTGTKSGKNSRFYNVMGGFWESGPQSGCFDARYSYFPQNRHNPVGFRCCSNARPRLAETKRGTE